MRAIQALFVLALVSIATAHAKYPHHGYNDPCVEAYLECGWEFFGIPGQIPVFPVHTKPDRSFTPRVVSKHAKEKIGILNTNHVIPEFILGKYALPITIFGSPRFTPTHFKPFPIDYVKGSGVGHQTFQGNQKDVAKGKCMRVFFTAYQKVMQGHPPKVVNVNVHRSDYKCVVFRLH